MLWMCFVFVKVLSLPVECVLVFVCSLLCPFFMGVYLAPICFTFSFVGGWVLCGSLLMHWMLHECVDWHVVDGKMVIYGSSCSESNDFVGLWNLGIVWCKLVVWKHVDIGEYYMRQPRRILFFQKRIPCIFENT